MSDKSIDIAIMKTKKGTSFNSKWVDIGSWKSVWKIQKKIKWQFFKRKSSH